MSRFRKIMGSIGAMAGSVWQHALGRKAAIFVMTFGVIGGAGFGLSQTGHLDKAISGGQGFAEKIAVDAGFIVKSISVEGNDRVSEAMVLARAGVRINTPMMDIDPADIRHDIEALGWIASARVYRALPDSLTIEIKEREPFAVWQIGGVHHLIDRQGDIIVANLKSGFEELLMVIGEGADVEAAKLVKVLDEVPQLASRVVIAVRVSNRRWNLKLDNEVDIRLPEEDVVKAWTLLAALQEEHRLLSRDVTAIDLRTPGQLILRTTVEAGEQRLGDGKNT